jgi:4-amino-4-deoxy-L-arabinose transferase-like glycosyltransferase
MKINNFFKLSLIVIALIILPLFTFAQTDPNDPTNWPDAADFDSANNPASNEIDNVTPLNDNNSSGNSGGSGFSCSLGANPKFDTLVNYITCLISSSIIPLIFALAFMLFMWGVVQYVINDTEEAKREKGKQFMIWGIIALFVMFSVWGLVKVLTGTFGIEYVIPQVAD